MFRVSYSDMPDRNLPTMRQRRKVRSNTSDAAISVTSSPMSSEASRPSGYFPSTTSSSPGKAGEYFGSADAPHSGTAVSPACSAASRSTWLRFGPGADRVAVGGFEKGKIIVAHGREQAGDLRLRLAGQAGALRGQFGQLQPGLPAAPHPPELGEVRRLVLAGEVHAVELHVPRLPLQLEEPQPIVLRRAGDDVRDFLDPGDHRFVAAEGIVRAPLDDQVRERRADARAEFLVEPLHDREDADRRHDRQRHRQRADEVEPVPPEISKRDKELIHGRPGKPDGHGLKA